MDEQSAGLRRAELQPLRAVHAKLARWARRASDWPEIVWVASCAIFFTPLASWFAVKKWGDWAWALAPPVVVAALLKASVEQGTWPRRPRDGARAPKRLQEQLERCLAQTAAATGLFRHELIAIITEGEPRPASEVGDTYRPERVDPFAHLLIRYPTELGSLSPAHLERIRREEARSAEHGEQQEASFLEP